MTYAEKVEYYANINNTICISNGNGKTGAGVYTLSFPVEMTCRPDAPCRKYCYACKGNQQYASVKGAYYRNYRIYTESPALFWRQVEQYILLYDIHVLRICDCGDIPDADFLTGLNTIARNHPEMIIYAYTKKYEMFNEWYKSGNMAGNFTMWFSAWDKSWKFENPHNMPVAYVDFTNKEDNPEIPATAFKCPGRAATCTLCRACFSGRFDCVKFEQH